jgi:phosphoglycerate dehydrogenase-like enzyme
VAHRAKAFGMDVIAHDPYVAPGIAAELGIPLVSFDGLLTGADIISLHATLTQATRCLIGRRELRMMRKGTLLVNTARGGLVDELALTEALEDGHLGGAALDVFADEPHPNERLTRHPNVVATPHLGGSTIEAQARVSREIAREVLAVLSGTSNAVATCG